MGALGILFLVCAGMSCTGTCTGIDAPTVTVYISEDGWEPPPKAYSAEFYKMDTINAWFDGPTDMPALDCEELFSGTVVEPTSRRLAGKVFSSYECPLESYGQTTCNTWEAVQYYVIEGDEDTLVTHFAVSEDPNYSTEGVCVTTNEAGECTAWAGVEIADVTVSTDDDAASVRPTEAAITITEGLAAVEFDVTPSAIPADDVVLALEGDDAQFTLSPSSITFGAAKWDTPVTVTVTAIDDLIDEDDSLTRAATFTATSVDTNFDGVTETVQVTVVDDDTVAVLVVPPSAEQDILVTEAGTTDTFTLKLGSLPQPDAVSEATAVTGSMLIYQGHALTGTALTSNPTMLCNADEDCGDNNLCAADTEASLDVSSVVFTTTNWNEVQTITVTAFDDDYDEPAEHTTRIEFTVNSSDSDYAALTTDSLDVSIADDDTAGVSFADNGALAVSEAGTTDTFTVVLDSMPFSTVSVAVTGDSHLQLSQSLEFSPSIWDTPQSVTVAAAADDVDGDTVDSTITPTAASDDGAYGMLTLATFAASVADDDTAGVTLSTPTTTEVTEGGIGQSYTVVLDSEPTAVLTVTLSASPVDQITVSPATIEFSAGTWDSAVSVSVTAVNDDVAEVDATITVSYTVASSDAKYEGFSVSPLDWTVKGDDVAGITVQPTTDITVTEGGAASSVTVVLNSEPTEDIEVVVSGVTAQFTVTPSRATFGAANWNTPVSMSIAAVDDNFVELDVAAVITFGVAETTSEYNGVDTVDINVTVESEDTASVITSESSIELTEAGSSEEFTVRLSSESIADISVSLTASSGIVNDVQVSPAALIFSTTNYAVPQTVTVSTVDDEPVETGSIALTLGGDDAAFVQEASVSPITIQIIDDDKAEFVLPETIAVTEGECVDLEVSFASHPGSEVTFGVSEDSEYITLSQEWTVQPADWNQPIAVSVCSSNGVTNDQTATLTFAVTSTSDSMYSGITGTVAVDIKDKDVPGIFASAEGLTVTEGAAGVAFSVSMTGAPVSDITVTVSGVDATYISASPATLTYTPANYGTPQTITVTATSEDVAYDEQTITLTVTTSGTERFAFLTDTVTVTRKDADSVGLIITPTTLSLEEGETGSITAQLATEPLQDVILSLTGNSAVGVGAAITFTSSTWSTPQTVAITATDNEERQATAVHTVTVAASGSDAKYNALTRSLSVTVTDNDLPAFALSKTTAAVTEGGATDAYTVTLAAKPSSDVTVALTADVADQLIFSPSSLVFTSTDWTTGKTMTVTAVNDMVAEEEVTVNVETKIVSDHPVYAALSAQTVAVTVTDEDTAGVTMGSAPVTVTENDAGPSYALVLDTKPLNDVAITMTASDAAISVTRTSLTFTADNWDSNTGFSGDATCGLSFLGQWPALMQWDPYFTTAQSGGLQNKLEELSDVTESSICVAGTVCRAGTMMDPSQDVDIAFEQVRDQLGDVQTLGVDFSALEGAAVAVPATTTPGMSEVRGELRIRFRGSDYTGPSWFNPAESVLEEALNISMESAVDPAVALKPARSPMVTVRAVQIPFALLQFVEDHRDVIAVILILVVQLWISSRTPRKQVPDPTNVEPSTELAGPSTVVNVLHPMDPVRYAFMTSLVMWYWRRAVRVIAARIRVLVRILADTALLVVRSDTAVGVLLCFPVEGHGGLWSTVALLLFPSMVPRCRTRCQLFVKTEYGTGGTVTINNVDLLDTVWMVKENVEAKTGVPVRQQCLTASGRPLDDDRTLHSCGIGGGSTLSLHLRIRGGGKRKRSEMTPRKESLFEQARRQRDAREALEKRKKRAEEKKRNDSRKARAARFFQARPPPTATGHTDSTASATSGPSAVSGSLSRTTDRPLSELLAPKVLEVHTVHTQCVVQSAISSPRHPFWTGWFGEIVRQFVKTLPLPDTEPFYLDAGALKERGREDRDAMWSTSVVYVQYAVVARSVLIAALAKIGQVDHVLTSFPYDSETVLLVYVGEAANFGVRQKQHLTGIRGGAQSPILPTGEGRRFALEAVLTEVYGSSTSEVTDVTTCKVFGLNVAQSGNVAVAMTRFNEAYGGADAEKYDYCKGPHGKTFQKFCRGLLRKAPGPGVSIIDGGAKAARYHRIMKGEEEPKSDADYAKAEAFVGKNLAALAVGRAVHANSRLLAARIAGIVGGPTLAAFRDKDHGTLLEDVDGILEEYARRAPKGEERDTDTLRTAWVFTVRNWNTLADARAASLTVQADSRLLAARIAGIVGGPTLAAFRDKDHGRLLEDVDGILEEYARRAPKGEERDTDTLRTAWVFTVRDWKTLADARAVHERNAANRTLQCAEETLSRRTAQKGRAASLLLEMF